MARTAIVAPSWDLFREAAEHINCAVLGDAEYRKQEAALPAIWRIGAVCYVTTGAHYEGQAGLPALLWCHVVEPAAAHEQDDRTHRPPEHFYDGRVFRCQGQRWKIISPAELLPPEGEPPAQLEQQSLF